MASESTVVVLGRSPEKMRAATTVLETHGFAVVGVFTEADALRAIAGHDSLLAVVAGGSVSAAARERLRAAAAAHGAVIVDTVTPTPRRISRPRFCRTSSPPARVARPHTDRDQRQVRAPRRLLLETNGHAERPSKAIDTRSPDEVPGAEPTAADPAVCGGPGGCGRPAFWHTGLCRWSGAWLHDDRSTLRRGSCVLPATGEPSPRTSTTAARSFCRSPGASSTQDAAASTSVSAGCGRCTQCLKATGLRPHVYS